jgi:hypothetical protein
LCAKSTEIKGWAIDKDGVSIKIIEIDGCEYIASLNGHLGWIYSHKGNCKNKIHIYNKEQ